MSINIEEICRVCLSPATAKKNSNLFFSAGRSVQLWAKVMACAWVQVYEGDGLPSQICYKCHNKLDIAYQFKQQCEAADAHIRQILNRSSNEKSPSINIDLTQNQPDCLAECKPLNFNVTSECLDLAQTDFSLTTYRVNQDVSLHHQIDFRLRDSDLALMKHEPGIISSLNAFNNLPLPKNDCQVNSSSFKCESFNENDILLDNLPAKLFESVDATINQGTIELTDHNDSKLPVWNLNQKDPTISSISNKSDFIFNSEDNSENSDDKENSHKDNEPDISFLSVDFPVNHFNVESILPDVCSDSSAMDIENDCDFSKIEEENLPSEHTVKETIKPAITSNECSEPIVETKKVKKKKQNQNKKHNKSNENSDTVQKPGRKPVQEQCELCGKVFKYRSYMVHHLRLHSGDKPFSCSICDQKFTLRNSLAKHQKTHTSDRPYICAVCGKCFRWPAGLKFHMRAHTGEKPYECDVCDKKFSQKSNLIIHKQIHSGQRDHICTICQKAFKFYKHLQSHLSLHSGVKGFKCSLCDKSFHRKNQLNNHLSVHTGERAYKCDICGYASSNSSNLRSHSRIHTGVKPYKCKICKKAFSQSSAMKRHMQQHLMCLNPNNAN
ncbi:uncharacterized protein LOC143911753 isoform X1 [Arctopsyche grandis]|uniref:uncharacterized protein LOC143911753 isoform X1 n=1 Tax=Arctopsyche grandis TaxID=121162 RepID=UPI00406D9377